MNFDLGSRLSNCSRFSGTSIMRCSIGSFSPVLEAAKNQPATNVLGTVAVSTTLILDLGFSAEKYAAAACTSVSVMSFDSEIIKSTFLLGTEVVLAPLL